MLRLVSKITKIANPGKIGGKTGLREGEKGLSPGRKTGPGGRLRSQDEKGKHAEKLWAVSIYYLFCSV